MAGVLFGKFVPGSSVVTMGKRSKKRWYQERVWQVVMVLIGCGLLLAIAERWYNSGKLSSDVLESRARGVRDRNAAKPSSGPANSAGNANSDPAKKDAAELPENFDGTMQTVEQRKDAGGGAVLREVRAGAHEKYDRVVFEFEGASVPGYHVEYVNEYEKRCPSGDEYRSSGGNLLVVRLSPATGSGKTLEELISGDSKQMNYPALLALQSTCMTGAQLEYVLHLSARKPFRAEELANPARLVIDVKH